MIQSKILIRECNTADIPDLANLMIELGYSTTPAEMAERLKHIQSNTDYKTIVATDGNEVVGMIGLIKNFFWEQNGHYVKVQALVVKHTYRKKSVGELLMKNAEAWAKEIGAIVMALNCGNKEERNAAHKFYPRMGFQHTSSGYIKQLQ